MGKYKRSDGYIEVKRSDIADTKSEYMKEHRAIWIDHYGGIPEGAVIHHINGQKDDNRIENLELFPDKRSHMCECHADYSWLDPDRSILKPFTEKEMSFIRDHLPIDRVLQAQKHKVDGNLVFA